MNRKIEIWKRKLAKNTLKQKMAVWKQLTQIHPAINGWIINPHILHGFAVEDEIIETLATKIKVTADQEVLKKLQG